MYLHAPECVCLFTGLQLAHCWLLSGLPDWDCLILTQTLVKTRTANKKNPKVNMHKIVSASPGRLLLLQCEKKTSHAGSTAPNLATYTVLH